MGIKRICFLLCLLLVCVTGMAQFPGYTKTADRYFTEEEYHTLIRQAAIDAAKDQDIPESIFIDSYPENRQLVEGITRFLIIKKFRWLENGFSAIPAKGTAAFAKRKETYARELQRGVRDALLTNQGFFLSFRKKDETDRVLSFHADITINTQGVYQVVETIRIYNGNGGSRSTNDEIKRGISRTFPTQYTNSMGLRSTVPFRLKKVLLNKETELYHTENAENGIALYIGRPDQFLPAGVFTYEITYETEKQIIYHADKDECYWNVTGNGWHFSFEKISCSIHFPNGASVTESACYTGKQGAVEKNCSGDSSKTNTINFATNRILLPYEGLTVAASIRKGILTQPSSLTGMITLMKDNIILPVLSLMALAFLFIYTKVWRRVGRDPKRGVIIPQFAPPANMSAADTGYLLDQGYGAHLFAASIVDHAVNNLVSIEVKKEGMLFKTPAYYFLAPQKPNRKEETPEKYYKWYGYYIDSLFGQKAQKGHYNPQIAGVYSRLEQQLKERLQVRKGKTNSFKGLFSLNDHYIGLGIVALIVTCIGMIIYLALFHTPALIVASIILFLICIAIQVIFMKIMSAYTSEGRAIADHVEGFKMYLQTAEQHKFDVMNPPEMNLQLFEKYLPYAIALKCENAWSEKFAGIIEQAAAQGYEPSYFNSTGNSFSSAAFTSGISSGLAGTIVSASTPPSSSSGGSSGGGSSGGGGGGGGGGGW